MKAFNPENFVNYLTEYSKAAGTSGAEPEHIVAKLDAITDVDDWSGLKNAVSEVMTSFGYHGGVVHDEHISEEGHTSEMLEIDRIAEIKNEIDSLNFGFDSYIKNHLTQNSDRYLQNIFGAVGKKTNSNMFKELKYFIAVKDFMPSVGVTYPMAQWIILTHAKQCCGGIPDDLSSQLKNETAGGYGFFAKAQRITVFRVMFSLGLSLDEAREWLRDGMNGDDFDPRSICELLFSFALYNELPYCPGKQCESVCSVMEKAKREIHRRVFGDDGYLRFVERLDTISGFDRIIKRIKEMYTDTLKLHRLILAYCIINSENAEVILKELGDDAEAFVSYCDYLHAAHASDGSDLCAGLGIYAEAVGLLIDGNPLGVGSERLRQLELLRSLLLKAAEGELYELYYPTPQNMTALSSLFSECLGKRNGNFFSLINGDIRENASDALLRASKLFQPYKSSFMDFLESHTARLKRLSKAAEGQSRKLEDYERDLRAAEAKILMSASPLLDNDALYDDSTGDTIAIFEEAVGWMESGSDSYIQAILEARHIFERPDISKSRSETFLHACDDTLELYGLLPKQKSADAKKSAKRKLALLLEGEAECSSDGGILTKNRFSGDRMVWLGYSSETERSDFLRIFFLQSCSLKAGNARISLGEARQNKFVDDLNNVMPDLRYGGFNEYNILDRLFYLCLDTENPIETYRAVMRMGIEHDKNIKHK